MLKRAVRKLEKMTGPLRRRDRIFLLSHMRANTSLFGHLLGSNPQIEGYYELHENYTSSDDFKRAKLKYYRSHPPKNGAIYLFDKILHNNHRFDHQLLGPNDKVVIMIRAPAPSVDSVLKIFADKPDSRWSTREEAERYYWDRLEGLMESSRALQNDYFFLTSEELVGDSVKVLAQLTEFLALDTPLREEYSTFEKTGRRGFGDSSEDITAGKILSGKRSRPAPSSVAKRCKSTYAQALEVLRSNARTEVD